MKQTILLLGLALFLSFSSEAQSAVNPQNKDYVAPAFDGYKGHFDHAISSRETVVASYAFTPARPVNSAHFVLHTAVALPFRANITNEAGKVVYRWEPGKTEMLYETDINLSKLKRGNYTLNIYIDPSAESVQSIAFSKD